MSSTSNIPDNTAAQVACMLLIGRYAHAADGRDNDAFVSLFAPDGEWVRLDGTHRMCGRGEIRKFLEEHRGPGRSRHVSGSIDIQVVSPDRAKGLSYTIVYRDPNWKGSGLANFERLPDAVVEYHDDFVLIEGVWYFARREARYIYMAEGAVVPKPN